MTIKEIISAFESGSRANRENIFRQGNLIQIKGSGEVIMTGDLHGHQRNFEKLVRFAKLDQNPQRHLILHELLHNTSSGQSECHSYLLVAQAAELKARFPNQVHYILGNHGMSQVARDEVLKNGQPMVRALHSGMSTKFAEKAGLVIQALDDFLLSLPLAVRTDNRIWMSHSLPSERNLGNFDDDIFRRELTLNDMKTDSSLHALTWDRSHSEECLNRLRQRWDVDLFIVGHQPQAEGKRLCHERMMILASDHNHGCFLPFDLVKQYQPDELFSLVKPLAMIM